MMHHIIWAVYMTDTHRRQILMNFHYLVVPILWNLFQHDKFQFRKQCLNPEICMSMSNSVAEESGGNYITHQIQCSEQIALQVIGYPYVDKM